MIVIGVDCATKENKTGIVGASWTRATLRIEDAVVGTNEKSCVDVLSTWIARNTNVLLAFDAPLGWPTPLGLALAAHSAGEVLSAEPDEMFGRTTDHRIKERLGKRPLEVGANLIARTAHSALKLLEGLRRRTGQSIPLIWEPKPFAGIGAIEVYPAATRIALEIPKNATGLDGLSKRMGGDLSKLGANPHLLDAAWCVVAGADFLTGLAEAPTPSDLETAKREGWIWARAGVAAGRRKK